MNGIMGSLGISVLVFMEYQTAADAPASVREDLLEREGQWVPILVEPDRSGA